jgi:hypothetical protein
MEVDVERLSQCRRHVAWRPPVAGPLPDRQIDVFIVEEFRLRLRPAYRSRVVTRRPT